LADCSLEEIMNITLAILAALFAQLWPNPGPGRAPVGGGGGGTTINAGFSFRSTLGYVTDAAGDKFVATTDSYPQTATIGGFSTTYGHFPQVYDASFGPTCNGTVNGYDRNAGIDPRLAGMHLVVGGDCMSFGVLLPSTGSYDIVLAAGDPNAAQGPMTIEIYDGTTLRQTVVTGVSPSGAQWYDATGTLRTSAADWVTNGSVAIATVAMSTTHLAVKITTTGAGLLSYLHITNN
jgi:hypothetical protein